MRALLRPNGAVAAGWSHGWKYSWPRDSSFAAAAFAHTGHDAEAYRILRYSAATQRADGVWEARTKLDGSGPPDARAWQLDANGWVPWATWQWYQAAPRATRGARLATLYPMIRKAADHAAGSLRADGLPPASPDYWELTTPTANIGTAAPLLAGLNASADLAREANRPEEAARWARAARRLSAGISAHFLPWGTSGPSTDATGTTAPWPSWRPLQRGPRRPGRGTGHHLRGTAAAQRRAEPRERSRRALGRVRLDAQYGLLRARVGRHGPAREGRTGHGLGPLEAQRARRTAGEGGRVGPALLGRPLAWTGSLAVLALVALDGPGLPTPPLTP